MFPMRLCSYKESELQTITIYTQKLCLLCVYVVTKNLNYKQ
jgi:hypothetical protein